MKFYLYILTGLAFMFAGKAFSQPLYGFQSIGVHTFFVGLKIEKEPNLSLGYVYRAGGGTSFRDFSAEWQFPLEDPFQTKNSTFVAGVYGPLRQTGRPFVGLGAHARIKRSNSGKQKTRYELAITGLPSYTFTGILSDRPYPTAGARLTYFVGLYEQTEKEAFDRSKALPYHGGELGLHVDFMLERTLGIGLNAYLAKTLKLIADELPEDQKSLEGAGDLYFGPTYNLRRW